MLMVEEIFNRIKNLKRSVNLNSFPRIYTGMGARNPKNTIKEVIEYIAATLAEKDFILYSGGSPGCQVCFEKGCDKKNGMKNIFIPWKDYNNSNSPLISWGRKLTSATEPLVNDWKRMAPEVRYLHIRNTQMLLGYNLDKPSKLIICWFPYLSYEYGTIVNYANLFHIPIFNIYIATDLKYILDYILKA